MPTWGLGMPDGPLDGSLEDEREGSATARDDDEVEGDSILSVVGFEELRVRPVVGLLLLVVLGLVSAESSSCQVCVLATDTAIKCN